MCSKGSEQHFRALESFGLMTNNVKIPLTTTAANDSSLWNYAGSSAGGCLVLHFSCCCCLCGVAGNWDAETHVLVLKPSSVSGK